MRLKLPAASLILVLAACGADHEPVYRHPVHTMGTRVTFNIYATEQQQARKAGEHLEQQLQAFSAAWWSWGEGALGRINRQLRQGKPAPVAPEIRAGLERALDLSMRTGGYFNPAMGRLVALWGMHRPTDSPAPPEPSAIQALLPIPDVATLIPRDGLITPPAPLILDSGGFAKGLALSQALETLQQLGIERALIDAGGDLALLGQHPGRPWRVGIRDPEGGIMARLTLPDDGLAIFSSGDYERGFEHGGERHHHILDPHTGTPVRHTRAVTVLHGDPLVADIAATAIFVAGPQQWPEVARNLGVRHVLRLDSEGTVHLTRAMSQYLETEPGQYKRVIHDIF